MSGFQPPLRTDDWDTPGFTLQPGKEQLIVIETSPRATCVMTSTGETPTEPLRPIQADSHGLIQFHMRADSAFDESIVELTVTDGGRDLRLPLRLRADESATKDMPFAPWDHPQYVELRTRDPLTEKQAQSIPQRELLERGFPPRPASSEDARPYARWLKVVTSPSTLVEPCPLRVRKKEQTDHDGTWSGYELRPNPIKTKRYAGVLGQWTVPRITALIHNGQPVKAASSIWIGLDGDQFAWSDNGLAVPTSIDLPQAGTEQDDNLTSIGYNPVTGKLILISIPAYNLWATDSVWETSLLTLAPLDRVLVFLTITDDQGNPTVAGPHFNASFEITTPRGNSFSLPWSTTISPIDGISAEWIVERPIDPSNNPYPLAPFGSVVIEFAYAVLSGAGQYSTVACNGASADSSVLIEMEHPRGTVLSQPSLGTQQSVIDFQWQGSGL